MTQPTSPSCPTWCARTHGELHGEEDTVHVSDHATAGNMMLRMCATIDPATGEEDGPYLLLGVSELTLDQAQELIDALRTLIAQGRGRAARTPGFLWRDNKPNGVNRLY